MSLLAERAGQVVIRVGGNTQDRAILNIDGNPNNHTIQKYLGTGQAPVSLAFGWLVSKMKQTHGSLSRM